MQNTFHNFKKWTGNIFIYKFRIDNNDKRDILYAAFSEAIPSNFLNTIVDDPNVWCPDRAWLLKSDDIGPPVKKKVMRRK